MNEELRTVNQENRNKVEELAALSADVLLELLTPLQGGRPLSDNTR